MAHYESLDKDDVLAFLEKTNPDAWRLYQYQEIEEFRTVYGLEYWVWFPDKGGKINDLRSIT